jgi:raffinose synthase
VITDICLPSTYSFANRLYDIKENYKFQKNGRKGHREDDPAYGLAHIVSEIKGKHELKYGVRLLVCCRIQYNKICDYSDFPLLVSTKSRYVYVWHAITGYWGGVRPGSDGMEHYQSKIQYPVSSPGVQKNEPCDAFDSIAANGLGLVNPDKVFSFYNDLHSYLASAGIDGVKVDVQNILESLGAGHGGRVLLTRKYQQALEASIARNFRNNDIISCMSQNTDNLYR